VCQAAEATPSASEQLRKFPTGAGIQVHLVDGRVLEGKLVSSSGDVFELLELGQPSAETIEYCDVTSVAKISDSPRQKRRWVVPAVVAGVVVAATAIAVSRAGTLY
jgi:hypothetical protein